MIFGSETFKIEFNNLEFSKSKHYCYVERNIVPEKVQHFNNYLSLWEWKKGNRASFKIEFNEIVTQNDLDILEGMNGELVTFTPHIDAPFYKLQCWLWYFYDDAIARKHKVHIELVGYKWLEDFPAPKLTLTPHEINFGSIYVGEELVFDFNVNGEYLVGNLEITPPDGFYVSKDGMNYEDYIEYTYEDGEINENGEINTTIFVKFIPTESKDYSGFINCATNVSSTLSNKTVKLIAFGIVPFFYPHPDSINFGMVEVGTNSQPKRFKLQGNDLKEDITVRVTTPYQVSESEHSGYSQEIIVSKESVQHITWAKFVYVRVNPLAEQNYRRNIECLSLDVETKIVNCFVRGTVIPQPNIWLDVYVLYFDAIVKDGELVLAFDIEGFNLTGDIIITSNNEYITLSIDDITYNDEITTDDILKTIYVKYNPLLAGIHNTNLIIASTGVENIELTIYARCILENIINNDSISFVGISPLYEIADNNSISYIGNLHYEIPIIGDNDSLSFTGLRNYEEIDNNDSLSLVGNYSFENNDSLAIIGIYDFTLESLSITGHFKFDNDLLSFLGEEQTTLLSQLLTINL